MLSPPARSASDSKTWSRRRFVIVRWLSRESRRHPRELPCLRLFSHSCCLTFSTADPRTGIRGDRTYQSRRSLRGVALFGPGSGGIGTAPATMQLVCLEFGNHYVSLPVIENAIRTFAQPRNRRYPYNFATPQCVPDYPRKIEIEGG